MDREAEASGCGGAGMPPPGGLRPERALQLLDDVVREPPGPGGFCDSVPTQERVDATLSDPEHPGRLYRGQRRPIRVVSASFPRLVLSLSAGIRGASDPRPFAVVEEETP